MAELLRDNPVLIAGLVILLAVMLAARRRRAARPPEEKRPRPGRPRTGAAKDAPERSDETPAETPAETTPPTSRRARLQMILALFCILGFTLIAIVNSF